LYLPGNNKSGNKYNQNDLRLTEQKANQTDTKPGAYISFGGRPLRVVATTMVEKCSTLLKSIFLMTDSHQQAPQAARTRIKQQQ